MIKRIENYYKLLINKEEIVEERSFKTICFEINMEMDKCREIRKCIDKLESKYTKLKIDIKVIERERI